MSDKLLFLPAFFFVLTATYAQSTREANQLAATADSLHQAGWYQQSTIYLQKASEHYRQNALWKQYVRCLIILSENSAGSREYTLAQAYAEAAVEYSQRQSPQAVETSLAYHALSQAFIHQNHYDSAQKYYYLAAVDQPTSPENNLLYHAQLTGTLAKILSGRHDTDSAKMLYRQAIHSLETGHQYPLTLADLYLHLGICYGNEREYDTAIYYCTKSLNALQGSQITSHPIEIGINNQLAIYFNAKSDLAQSLTYFIKTLDVQEHFFGEEHPYTASCYSRIGTVYLQTKAFSKAQAYLDRAVHLLENSEDKYHLAIAYMSLGVNATRSGDFMLAKTSLQNALATWQVCPDQDSTLLASIFSNTGVSYEKAEKLDTAMIYYQKALAVLEETTPKNDASISIYLHNIGNLYLAQQQLPEALSYAQQALSVRQAAFGKKHERMASSWGLLGEIYTQQRDKNQALRSFQQALIANTLHFEDTLVSSNPCAASGCLDAYELLETLYYKATTLLTQQPSAADAKLALSTLQLSDTIIEQLHHSYQNHDDRITLQERAKDIYRAAVVVSIQLFLTENDPAYVQQAFYFSEKSKASVLTHALAELSAQHQAGIPDSLLNRERALSIDRAYYTSQIQTEKSNAKADSSVLHYCQDRLFAINIQYDSLIQLLEAQYPRYYTLKYRSPVITVPQLQQQLAENTTLVSSFLSDSIIYQFVVTPDTLRVVAQPYDSTLLSNITQLRSTLTPEAITELSQATYHQYTQSASFLYQMLLDSALSLPTTALTDRSSKLIIIADDVLGYVPFDVLLTQPIHAQVPDYRSLPYLLKRYDVSYGYSATWLFQPTVKSGAEAPRELVAFASSPTEASNNQPLPLVWNQTEVDKVSHHVATQSYTGPQAQEHRFKTEADQYRLIHLAMHGYADEEDPLESRIVFSSAEGNHEDNILYARELYDMQLSADLAVLSACQTGSGALAQGEGILSLARAFAYAGCASVVMSHWAADDQSTATLMDYFYQYLAEGKPKDQALSEAKRTFLSKAHAAFTHPYYWGNFMLVGNSDPIISHDPKQTIYLVLSGMALLLIVIASVRKRL